MARPLKSGMDYFPHDTDAMGDEKVEALQALYGNDGYAFYFKLLERIYRTERAELDVSDAETIQILARKVGVADDRFKMMLETALKRGLFDKEIFQERHALTSDGIKRRAAGVLEKRDEARSRYFKTKLTPVSTLVSASEMGVETTQAKQSKVKQSKAKEVVVETTATISGTSEKKGLAYQPETTQDPRLTAIVNLYEQEIGLLTPMVAEELKDLVELPESWFPDAVREACTNNKRKLSYIKAILKRWETEGKNDGAHKQAPAGVAGKPGLGETWDKFAPLR